MTALQQFIVVAPYSDESPDVMSEHLTRAAAISAARNALLENSNATRCYVYERSALITKVVDLKVEGE